VNFSCQIKGEDGTKRKKTTIVSLGAGNWGAKDD